MIKYQKATLDTIKRFPALYKMQAMQALDKEVRKAINITADTFTMAFMIAAIEVFGLGTKEGSTRLPNLVSKVQDIVDTSADFYDDAVAEGLKNRLQNEYGVEYCGR